MRPRWRFRAAVLCLLTVAVILACVAPALAQTSGAVWTTDKNGDTVNENFFDRKSDVYLNGGPAKPGSAGLTPGLYYVMITDPSGKVVLGRSWNSDSSIVRRVNVGSDGEFPNPIDLWNFLFRGSSGFTRRGYDDTPNNGNEYKVWASTSINFDNDLTKTDNFKVKQPDILKTWQVRVPNDLLLRPGLNIRAFYSTEPPDTPLRDWDFVDLTPDPSRTGYYMAITEFDQPVALWWYFHVVVLDAQNNPVMTFESPEEGPESLTDEGGPYINDLDLSLKRWEFTPPTELVERGITIDAQYSTDDGDTWTDVALADPDEDGLFVAETLFVDPASITYRFHMVGGGFDFTSEAAGPETITGVVTKVNPLKICLKRWEFTAPTELAERGLTATAQYSTDDGDTWTDVALADGDADGVYTAETLFLDSTDLKYRFHVVSGDLDFTSEVAGPETISGIVTKVNPFALTLKRWEFTPPTELIERGIAVKAQYSEDDGDTWTDVALADGDADGVYTAETLFVSGTEITYRFALSGGGFDFTSEVAGPETISGIATKVNPFALTLKRWEFTPPTELIERGIAVKAQYSEDDGDTWTDVALADGDADGVYTAETLFVSGTEITYRFALSGGGFDFTSEVAGPETISGIVTKVNPFALTLKRWIIRIPTVLQGLPGISASYYYTTVASDAPAGDWVKVALTEDSGNPGTYVAETLFPSPTSIWYKVLVVGETGGNEFYRYEGGVVGPEVISGVATIENATAVPQGVKSWRLHVLRTVPGASYYAAWSVDGVTWFETPLTQDAGFPELWTGDTNLVDGLIFYWKFYGKIGGSQFWSTDVLGPEEMTSAGLVNEYWYYGEPRTIGYWMNWMNHFTQQQMNLIVAEVNSDANGFSRVFTSGVAGDLGQYGLSTGTKKNMTGAGTVAWYLGEAQNASEMYQMLRAQLLGCELNVAVAQAGQLPKDGGVIGLAPGALVYLDKLPTYTTDPAINPWGSTTPVPLSTIITDIENASASDWAAWPRAKQAFAKDVLDAINNNGHGSAQDVGILGW